MYLEFYRLSGMPFQLVPDSRFFFGSQQHNKAMAFLNYGISQNEGFVVVTGEVGAGKTTLVEHLLSTLNPTEYVSGRIVTTQLDSYDMLRMIGSAFNLFREGMDKATLLTRVKQFFSDQRNQGKRVLLIVDEAQSLSTEAVEELRMLSNMTISGNAPFQGIMLGQPEFRAVLSTAGLEQFRQRVTASYHLGALNPEDTRKYIEHRLHHVGWNNDPVFTDEAFAEIYKFAGGIPRRINTLCSRLLLLGYLEERHDVTGPMVASVANELIDELGPMVGSGVALRSSADPRTPTISHKVDSGLDARINRLEDTSDRHERAINRAFDIALRYLPGLKED
ncbi:MAG TPA: XrtA/PEP-CTERM system-associated ATPase [Rhizomicrobium sp.]|jgi:putative secretion ATPase (PEP-CTERM system associated)|nr:XrtA/PEP-CTERM system-associated ATPase [Rhizomicrobium sp.]